MMKKLATMLMLVMMAAALTACGCGTTNEGDGTVENTQPDTTTIEETTTEEDETSTEATQEDTANAVTGETVGNILLQDFRDKITANNAMTAQEMADALLTNSIIQFSGATMPVEEGVLTGFGNAEITGFKEGVMFAPMIGSIPFVGYIFNLEEGADADSFIQVLQDNADPRWNICTEAEETIVEREGNMVFFVMSPAQFE